MVKGKSPGPEHAMENNSMLMSYVCSFVFFNSKEKLLLVSSCFPRSIIAQGKGNDLLSNLRLPTG